MSNLETELIKGIEQNKDFLLKLMLKWPFKTLPAVPGLFSLLIMPKVSGVDD